MTLNEERAIARQVILDWNNVHSEFRQIVLFPIGWEHNAFPAMGDRPQAILKIGAHASWGADMGTG